MGLLIIRQFDGGLNVRVDPLEIAPNESALVLNAHCDAQRITARKGSRRYNAIALSAAPYSIYRFYYGANRKFLARVATAVRMSPGQANGSLATSLFKASGLSTNTAAEFVALNSQVFICDGGSPNKCYDGSNTGGWGIPAALTAAAVAAQATAGGLNGAYSYKCTYVTNLNAEANATAASSTVNPANKRVWVTIPVGRGDVAKRKIYRTTAGGSSYLFATAVNDNVATKYDDNIADGSLGAAVKTDHNPPPAFCWTVVHKRRIYAAGNGSNPSRLYISNLDEPHYFPVVTTGNTTQGGFIDIDPGDGDSITGLGSFGAWLWVFKRSGIYRLFGQDWDDWVVQQFSDQVGCMSHRTIMQCENDLLFLTDGAVYAIDGSFVLRKLSDKIDPWLVRDTQGGIATANYTTAAAVFHDRRYILGFPSAIAVNNTYSTLVFDFRTGGWTAYSNLPGRAFSRWDGAGDSGELYMAHAGANFAVQLATGVADHITKYQWRWQSRVFDMAEPNMRKRLRRGHLYFGATAGLVSLQADTILPQAQAVPTTRNLGAVSFPQTLVGRHCQFLVSATAAVDGGLRRLDVEYSIHRPR